MSKRKLADSSSTDKPSAETFSKKNISVMEMLQKKKQGRPVNTQDGEESTAHSNLAKENLEDEFKEIGPDTKSKFLEGNDALISPAVKEFLASTLQSKGILTDPPIEAFLKLKGATFNVQNNTSHLSTISNPEDARSWRHPLDVPEMRTFCIYDSGRYAFWKDDPSSSHEILVVHASNDEHFPTIEVAGSKWEHVVSYIAKGNHEIMKEYLPTTADLKKINSELQDVVKKRNKIKLGSLPNRVGIWVPQKGDVGYRDLGMNSSELRKIIDQIGTHKSKAVRETNMEKIINLRNLTSIANDECDFGMGLELGHWLWLANYPALNDIACQILVLAYRLLDRQELADAVKWQTNVRRALLNEKK